MIGLVLLDAWLSHARPLNWMVGSVDLGAWLCNGLIATLLILALALATAREVAHFVRRMGFRPNRFVVFTFPAGLVIGPYLACNLPESYWHNQSWGVFWLSLTLGTGVLMQAWRRGTEHAMMNVASTVFIVLYTGGFAGYLTMLRMEVGGYHGAVVLLFSIFLVKINDTGAFFSGLLLGRHKLVPWLSPKKTWEGFFGGILITVLCAVFVGGPLLAADWLPPLNGAMDGISAMVVLGVLMALFSVAGDLTASLLKRDAAVKDSGEAIPGMGGILDIFDSPLLAAPVAWFYWTQLVPLGAA